MKRKYDDMTEHNDNLKTLFSRLDKAIAEQGVAQVSAQEAHLLGATLEDALSEDDALDSRHDDIVEADDV